MQSVQLNTSQKFSHYYSTILLLVFSITFFYYLIAGKTNHHFTALAAFLLMLFFLIIAVLAFYKQRKALLFHEIPCNVNNEKAMEACIIILKYYGWEIEKKTKSFIQATGKGFRGTLDLRTWSEMITIAVTSNGISVNSICNPDDWFAQFVSFGKNKQNIRDFEKFIKEALNIQACT